MKVHYKTHLKPRKGDYGDVPPPYTTIQVPLEQIEVQFQQQPEEQVLENVEYIPTVPTQMIQTETIQSNLPSYEIQTLQEISYANGLENTAGEENLILQPLVQPSISFAFWTPNTNFNGIGSASALTATTEI